MSIRTAVATGALIVVLGTALAQSPAPAPLDARASDPIAMGWMAGSPPPAAKVIRFADGSHYKFPQTRWAPGTCTGTAPRKRSRAFAMASGG